MSHIKFALGLFLYRNLWTGLKICKFTYFISHFNFHEKSARFLTIHRKICSVSETELTDEPEIYFVFSVANGNIIEIISALNRLHELAFPTMGLSGASPSSTSPASAILGCFSFHLAPLKGLASVMSAVASGFKFRECFLN